MNKSCVKPVNQNESDNDLAMADKFNKYFSNIGKSLQENIPETDEELMATNRNAPVFELEAFTEETIVKVIKELLPSTSCGVDGLTSRLIKTVGVGIVAPLTHIINLIIKNKCFLDSWKTACITPLHKAGDPSELGNFRLISILPCLGKLLERIVHSQIYKYLTTYAILAPEQSGLRQDFQLVPV